MCERCQAHRSGSGTAGLLELPSELLAHHDPGQPELQWTCPLCPYRCFVPTWLEDHAAAEHPGWVARFEVLRPYPRQVLRVVYRRADGHGAGEGSSSPPS